jgi:DNA-binding PadR family transcriptional regulator
LILGVVVSQRLQATGTAKRANSVANRAAGKTGHDAGLDKSPPLYQYGVMQHVVTQPDERESRPLSEPVLLILVSLANSPRHGYALMKDIEALSDGRVRISTGTLYGALRRLLGDGWIEKFEQDDTSREKQAYKLTSTGLRQLKIELDRMRQLTRAASARLRTKAGVI